jgi:hypothetical protein
MILKNILLFVPHMPNTNFILGPNIIFLRSSTLFGRIRGTSNGNISLMFIAHYSVWVWRVIPFHYRVLENNHYTVSKKLTSKRNNVLF